MTKASYAPRTLVHPDRYGSIKTKGPNRLAVLHTSEGSEGATSAKALCDFQMRPGDRTTPSGSRYGSSYAAVTDLNLLVRPCVPYDVVSYSASGANSDGVHLCLPGRAGQTRTQWLDPVSLDYIRTAAAWLVDVRDELGIPLRRLTPHEIRDGEWGVCDHGDITDAYHMTDHTDVGEHFPWDILWDEVNRYFITYPEDSMDILDYMPGTPSWARTTLSGRLVWVRGMASEVVDRTGARKQVVVKQQLLDTISSFGTCGPSPWDQTQDGHAPPDSTLHTAWMSNQRC